MHAVNITTVPYHHATKQNIKQNTNVKTWLKLKQKQKQLTTDKAITKQCHSPPQLLTSPFFLHFLQLHHFLSDFPSLSNQIETTKLVSKLSCLLHQGMLDSW